MTTLFAKPPRIQTITHIAVLQKFFYRLASDTLSPEQTHRLQSVIETYKRLYIR